MLVHFVPLAPLAYVSHLPPPIAARSLAPILRHPIIKYRGFHGQADAVIGYFEAVTALSIILSNVPGSPTLDAIHLSHISEFFRPSFKILRLLGLISCTVKPILPCNFSVTHN